MHFYDFCLKQNMLMIDFAVTRCERFLPQRDSAVVVKAACKENRDIDNRTIENRKYRYIK